MEQQFKRRNSDPVIEIDTGSVDNNRDKGLTSTGYKFSGSKSQRKEGISEMKSLKTRFQPNEVPKITKSVYSSISNLRKEKIDPSKLKKPVVWKNTQFLKSIAPNHQSGASNQISSSLNSSNFRSASTVVASIINERSSKRFNNSLEEARPKESSKAEVTIQKPKKSESSTGFLRMSKIIQFSKRSTQLSSSFLLGSSKGGNQN